MKPLESTVTCSRCTTPLNSTSNTLAPLGGDLNKIPSRDCIDDQIGNLVCADTPVGEVNLMFSKDVRQTRFRISDFQKYDLSISIAPDSNNVFRRVRYPVLFKLIEQFLTVVVVHQH